MAPKITPPIFVFDESDLTIFSSEEELIYTLGLELQDVEREEYHCYDALGFEVLLFIIQNRKEKRLAVRRGQCGPFDLRTDLADRLRRVGVESSPTTVLSDLGKRAIEKYGIV